MALKYFAYVFLSPGYDPKKNVVTTEANGVRFKAVGVDIAHKEQVVDVAKELVADGVQLIELCGGFGPTWIAKVCEATNNAVPIGGVSYGPEWRKPMLDILA
jgi:hypothetical protein